MVLCHPVVGVPMLLDGLGMSYRQGGVYLWWEHGFVSRHASTAWRAAAVGRFVTREGASSKLRQPYSRNMTRGAVQIVALRAGLARQQSLTSHGFNIPAS